MVEVGSIVLQLANYVVPATILAILALGVDLQWGHTGLFNAGVAAFVGLGAFLFGMFATGRFSDPATNWSHWGPPFPQDLVVSAAVAMLLVGSLGSLIAIPALRLRQDYLAIATLALAEIVHLILKNEKGITGGDQTLAFIPRPFGGLVPPGWTSDGAFMVVAVVILLGALFVLEFLTRLPWGRGLRAVREDEEAAQALGKNAFRFKLGAFWIGCAIMALAGALQASFNNVAVPDSYSPFLTFTAFVVVILGGSGNPRGVILGAYVYSLFGWGTQQMKVYLPEAWALKIDFVNQILIGLLLIVFILFRPEGIVPEQRYVPPKAG